MKKLPKDPKILETGCGAQPDARVVNIASHYTGVDFSRTGIERSREVLGGCSTPHELHVADACDLPFGDNTFDAVYSAHMIYHIVDPSAQAQAISEMVRVTRPGGYIVLVSANPRPVLFPARAFIRIIAENNSLRSIAERFRKPSPVPYNPQTTQWTRNQLEMQGEVCVTGYAVASTTFNHKVSEKKGVGRLLWKGINYLERNHPKATAYLGNYTCFICRVADSKKV